jgi:hypothetical protein
MHNNSSSSSSSSNRNSSSSSGTSVNAAQIAAAAVAGGVIDDDAGSSDASADVCSDFDDCITGLQSLQQISTEHSSTADRTWQNRQIPSNAHRAQQHAAQYASNTAKPS